MKTTISSFSALIERDYGASVAQEFLNRFTGETEVGFRQARAILHQVLIGTAPPAKPSFGVAMNSPSGNGSVRFKK